MSLKAYLYGALAAVILLMGLTTWWALSARDAAIKDLAGYQAAAATVIAERLAQEQEEHARNERRSKEIVNDYRKRLAASEALLAATTADRDAVSERLRNALAPTPAPEVSGGAVTPGGTDGGPGRDVLLAELAACLATADRLRALQDWIRSTH
jgi:hypothetical protein